MSSLRQIQANRLNARLSTGPITEEGKRKSRQNAVRHGLTAETVIGALEDAEDYAAFEMAVTSDYDAQTAVERELVLRLASLFWRLRRATAIETGLFEIQVRHLLEFRRGRGDPQLQNAIAAMAQRPDGTLTDTHGGEGIDAATETAGASRQADAGSARSDDITGSYIRLTNLQTSPLDRLSRYEAALWRQACQVLYSLHHLNRRRSWQSWRSRPQTSS